MPQLKFIVETELFVFDFEVFIGGWDQEQRVNSYKLLAL
jgi:hypothetical protein